MGAEVTQIRRDMSNIYALKGSDTEAKVNTIAELEVCRAHMYADDDSKMNF